MQHTHYQTTMVPNMTGAAPSNARNEIHVSKFILFVLIIYLLIDSATRKSYCNQYSFLSLEWKQEVSDPPQQHACRYELTAVENGKRRLTPSLVIFI